MTIRLEHGLAYVEADLAFRGKTLHLDSVVLDTGSASTLFASDKLVEIGIIPEPSDTLKRIRGIGGVEFVFTKGIDRLAVGEIAISLCTVENRTGQPDRPRRRPQPAPRPRRLRRPSP